MIVPILLYRAQGKLRTGEANLLSMLCCHWVMIRAVLAADERLQNRDKLQLMILKGALHTYS